MVGRKLFFYLFLFLIQGCSSTQSSNQEVIIRLPKDPQTANPIRFTSVFSLQIINLLFHSLLVSDPVGLKIQSNLAQSLPFASEDDSMSYFKYKLRREANWSNGSPVTPDDVLFSIKLLNCPLVDNLKNKNYFDPITNFQLDSVDDRSFTLTCMGGRNQNFLLSGDFAVLPKYVFDPRGLLDGYNLVQLKDQYEKLKKDTTIQKFARWVNDYSFNQDPQKLQGSAGYELEEWVTGQYIKLKKKPNWWGDEIDVPWIKAEPEIINFQIISDNRTALLALKNPKIDIYGSIPVDDFLILKQDKIFGDKYNLRHIESTRLAYFGFNSRLPKFRDPKTRQALARLINYREIINVTQAGMVKQAVGIIPPIHLGYSDPNIESYTFDPLGAKQLLLEAGWKIENDRWTKKQNGEILTLQLNLTFTSGINDYESIAMVIKEAFEKNGILVNIQPTESGLLTQQLKNHQVDVFIRSMVMPLFSFDYRSLFHTSAAGLNGFNYTGFGNSQTDSLIIIINSSMDTQERQLLIKEFQENFHQQATLIPLFFYTNNLAIHKRLSNLRLTPLFTGYDVTSMISSVQ